MSDLVTYTLTDGVATIAMDDGKPNALSPDMQTGLVEALDRASADGAAVVLHGRPGMFSAGFDLKVMSSGATVMADMILGGFRLAERLLSYPKPVVVGCTGHAVAMGAFLLLSADYRIGAAGAFKLTANEVAIGLPLPRSAVEICRARLAPHHLGRVLNNAEVYDPASAVEAGFLDLVVDPDEVVAAATAKGAEMVATLDAAAHTLTKLRVREPALTALRAAIDADASDLGASR